MVDDPNHEIGYLKGRLDGHDGRLSVLEQTMRELPGQFRDQIDRQVAVFTKRTDQQDKMLTDIRGMIMDTRTLISSWKWMILGGGAVVSIIFTLATVTAESHIWPFNH